MVAFKFLVSFPSGLSKRNKFTCRWILDGSDAEVGKFIDDLLDVKMKITKLDDLMAKMADPARMGPRPILPTDSSSATATAVAAAPASAVPRVPIASETHKLKKQSSKRDRAKIRKKIKVDEAFEKALGENSAWEHDVDPLKVAFPESFNYRKTLNAGLTSPTVWEALSKMPPEQLLGESYHLHAKSLTCLQVGVETCLAAKVKAEKELSTALDQIEILKGEKGSALSYLPFKETADTLKDELSKKSLEHQSALDRISQLEEDNRVLKTQFESSHLSLEAEWKRAVAAEGQVGSLAASLKTCQADLSKATEASEYWHLEWQTLGTEVTEMYQEDVGHMLGPSLASLSWRRFFCHNFEVQMGSKGKEDLRPSGVG
ncbi:hypothetical protein PIB30_039056 [Stylosanthes scabra]|uniref:Uncharacterized protein n=1 Tax=Stylosanthes scabra TaxID=79078 RepID=A0ABU6TEY6_9FABA|nr:hypothetical protein [Stylosanthes scabra]